MERLNKFINLDGMERRLLIEAFFWLGVAQLAVSLMPFRWLAPYLGVHMAESEGTVNPCHEDLLTKVAWAVRAAARNAPWEAKCLAQAITGKIILKCRRVPNTLYLGLAKENDRELIAHAWLRSGDVILTGFRGMQRYTVVSSFADCPSENGN